MDTLDYEGKTPEEMCERIKKKIRNGSIVLMHNDSDSNKEAMEEVILYLKQQGYRFGSLEELREKNQ